MRADMSALSLDEIQEVMDTMNSFDNIFRDSSERERNLFLDLIIKRTLEKSTHQKAQAMPKSEIKSDEPEVIIPPVYVEPMPQTAPIITPPTSQEVATIKPQTPTRIYGERWIVMQNRLLNAITNLELNERRLIMFLSPIVRKEIEKDPKQRTFLVKVKEFQEEYGIKGKYVYQELAKIADTILEKAFFFWYDRENGKAKKGVSWVSECDYLENEGMIKIKLDDTVIEMLTIFDKNNPFTKYERQMIINLGTYGIILFELIASCMHQKHKQKAYTIEYLREKFNCVDTYPTFYDFKRYVLDRAIKDIHEYTPFHIKYTQKKDKRKVTELVFSFQDTATKSLEDKKRNGHQRDPDTIDWVNGATDSEIKKAPAPSWQTKGLSDGQIKKLKVFAQEFCDSNTSKMSPTFKGSYDDLIEIWRPMLKDPSKVNSFNKVQELLDRKPPQ